MVIKSQNTAIQKARQQLKTEHGAIIKDWGGRLPVALVYPNSYYIGMSNHGLQANKQLLNHKLEVDSERAI